MTATPISIEDGYRLWASSWDSTPSPIVQVEARALAPWIEEFRASRMALDVGCGTGRWTSVINAFGVDMSIPMLRVAVSKASLTGRLACATACLPIATGTVDVLLCALTFGHLPDQLAALHEFARVLRPGGTLLFTDFHPVATAAGWRRTFEHEGRVYELENHPYSADWLLLSAQSAALQLAQRTEAFIGTEEKDLFLRAGRTDLFAAARLLPAVLLCRWERT